MKRGFFFLSLLALLASCQTFRYPWEVAYNDLQLSTDDQNTTLPGSSILTVKAVEESSLPHGWKVVIILTGRGTIAFSLITELSVGKQLSIHSKGQPILSATIVAPIPDGKITVAGYTREEAQRIVEALVKT